MKVTVLNDTHIGAIRSGGTTAASQLALRAHITSEFARLLPADGDLLIAGDLFDTYNVPISDLLKTFSILCDWLRSHPDSKLYNMAGNHDLAKNTSVMSSFQALGELLTFAFPDRYVHIEAPMNTPHGYVIPHCRNQELFNEALAAVPQDCDFLFVHVNIDNKFAAQSDHSLNMSVEQIEACPAGSIICAHEHHARDVGKVIVPGNQIATSVADWGSNSDKSHVVIEDGVINTVIAQERADNFEDCDWRNLSTATKKFVRVTGRAEANEASDALSALNAFRKSSDAFVVSNAIEMVGTSLDTEALAVNLETIGQFTVMAALQPLFTAEEFAKLEGLANA